MTLSLDELEALLEKATKGEWSVYFRFGRLTTINGRQLYPIADTATAPRAKANENREEANAALIVAAVNALPALIARARRADELEAEGVQFEREIRP